MEHLVGHNNQMLDQSNLPAVDSLVRVESWVRRGWVHQLGLWLQVRWPGVNFLFHNHGRGGATSRDIVKIVDEYCQPDSSYYDLVFVGCGINDVWRGYQNRMLEAVNSMEYHQNIAEIVGRLQAHSAKTIVLSETPFGSVETKDRVIAMNRDLALYNQISAEVARRQEVTYLDVWSPFLATAQHLASTVVDGRRGQSLWSDGVHLSELGDALIQDQVQTELLKQGTIDELLQTSSLEG